MSTPVTDQLRAYFDDVDRQQGAVDLDALRRSVEEGVITIELSPVKAVPPDQADRRSPVADPDRGRGRGRCGRDRRRGDPRRRRDASRSTIHGRDRAPDRASATAAQQVWADRARDVLRRRSRWNTNAANIRHHRHRVVGQLRPVRGMGHRQESAPPG